MRTHLAHAASLGLPLALLAACGQPSVPEPSAASDTKTVVETPELQRQVTGLVTLPVGVTLPADAVVKVDIRAPALETGPPVPLVSQTLAADDGPPYAFALTLPDDVTDTAGLVVFARAQTGPAIQFNNLQGAPLGPPGTPVSIALTSTGDWGTAGPGPAVTPQMIEYICGGELVAIAVEAGTAYVTIDGGDLVNLPLLEGAPEGVRQFSNGKAVVQIEGDEYGARLISFAWGRAAVQPCTR